MSLCRVAWTWPSDAAADCTTGSLCNRMSCVTLRAHSHRTHKQICCANLQANPLMLLASCVNTPIDHNVFHNLHARVARCSASCVNWAQKSVKANSHALRNGVDEWTNYHTFQCLLFVQFGTNANSWALESDPLILYPCLRIYCQKIKTAVEFQPTKLFVH